MDPIVIVYLLALAALGVLGVWVWGKATDRSHSAANRTVQRTSHRQGQAPLQETASVMAPPMSPSAVLDAVLKELNVFDEPPALGHKAYATRVAPDQLRVDFGNTLFTAWTVAITAEEESGRGVRVTVEPVQAQAVDGVMPGDRELGLLFVRVRACVRQLHNADRTVEPA